MAAVFLLIVFTHAFMCTHKLLTRSVLPTTTDPLILREALPQRTDNITTDINQCWVLCDSTQFDHHIRTIRTQNAYKHDTQLDTLQHNPGNTNLRPQITSWICFGFETLRHLPFEFKLYTVLRFQIQSTFQQCRVPSCRDTVS